MDVIEKVPEGVNAVSEAALNTFTKVAKRTLRKGLFGGTERDKLVKVSIYFSISDTAFLKQFKFSYQTNLISILFIIVIIVADFV